MVAVEGLQRQTRIYIHAKSMIENNEPLESITHSCVELSQSFDAPLASEQIEEVIGRAWHDHLTPPPDPEEERIRAVLADEYGDEILTDALNILTEQDPMEYLLEQHQKFHVGDMNAARYFILSIAESCCLSTQGLLAMPFMQGNSGMGKSHCVKAVYHLLPETVKFATTLSGKALYYMTIKPGTIFYSDDVALSEDLVGILKRATSAFQDGDTYITVSKDREPQTMTIPPRCVWWMTSVTDPADEQLANRRYIINVDESKGQSDNVVRHQAMRLTRAETEWNVTKDVSTARCMIDYLKQHEFGVTIPYAPHIVWCDKGNRRNFGAFTALLMCNAILHHRQRHVSIVDGVRWVEANEDDFWVTYALYNLKRDNKTMNVNDQELQILRALADHSGCPMTITDIQKQTNLTYATVRNMLEGRKDREGCPGLLGKIKGLSKEGKPGEASLYVWNGKTLDTYNTQLYGLACEMCGRQIRRKLEGVIDHRQCRHISCEAHKDAPPLTQIDLVLGVVMDVMLANPTRAWSVDQIMIRAPGTTQDEIVQCLRRMMAQGVLEDHERGFRIASGGV